MCLRNFLKSLSLIFVLISTLALFADDNIPPAAWKIAIGQAPPNPGGKKRLYA
jgi:non-lysosomal glucosylceramidase